MAIKGDSAATAGARAGAGGDSGKDTGGVLHACRHLAEVMQTVAESHLELRELLEIVAHDVLVGHADVATVEMKDDEDRMLVTLNEGVTDGSFIAELLIKNGFRLKTLKEEEIDLEDVFMGITKGITN